MRTTTNRLWSRFLFPLTPGVRGTLLFLGLAYLALMVDRALRAFGLHEWLALSPRAFWRGCFWQTVTYAFVPGGWLDFLINGFMIAWLGVWLERVWSRREFWSYCLIAAFGAGLARVAVTPSSPLLMVGSGAVVFGLLAAWARLFGHERVLLMAVWEMPVRGAAILMAAFALAVTFPCAGPINSFIMLCGGLAGRLYLSFRSKSRGRRQIVGNDRMNRLEL